MSRSRDAGPGARACLLAWLLAAAAATPAHETASGSADTVSRPYTLSPHYRDGDRFMGVRLLGAVELRPLRLEGQTVGGLSALAWDDDEGVLYALSDSGWLLHLAPELDEGRLVAAHVLGIYPLRNARGRRIRGREADAEGLVARGARNGRRGDTRLVASFERRVRIAELTPRGELLATRRLPAALRDPTRYATSNRALEAIADHPALGLLIAPERPMRGEPEDRVRLFALDGRAWSYPLFPTPNASLVAAEVLPGGSLLTLERGHGLFFLPVVIVLRIATVPADAPGAELSIHTVAEFDSSEGWSIDNFEGLTRHRGSRFYMVSDDNYRDLQTTILAYFELLDSPAHGEGAGSPEFEPVHKTDH